MKRFYANETVHVIDDNKFLYDLLLFVNQNRELMQKEAVTKLAKLLTDKVREAIGTENVIGFYGDENKLYVMEYDLKANDENIFIQKYDEVENDFYIEVGE